MGKPTGFIEYRREDIAHRPISTRIKDFFEINLPLDHERLRVQAARCMDCGIPFCHGSGCPVLNRIPEWNDLIYNDRWEEAAENLHSTNNFPEITGRVCPAPCEASCTLNINDDPVLIKHIEYQIAERAFAEGWVVPRPAPRRSNRRVAVVGSGPAGLACAQQLARCGHEVVLFEKDLQPGGLLRYGIPDFKLEKRIIDRRLEQLRAEGVSFECDVVAGEDLSARYLRKSFDAICLTMGAGVPRDLVVPGRELANVHFAMEFLAQQNRRNARELGPDEDPILATNKKVVVIGGGDTGSDCVGTSIRQGAAEVHQLEILPKPPEAKNPETPWPRWPRLLRTSSSHEEGCRRRWSVATKTLSGRGDQVKQLHGIEVEWSRGDDGFHMKERPGTEFTLDADLVLLAMGFVHVQHSGLVGAMDLELDKRGNIVTDDYAATEGVFAAGDAEMGASLVVKAIYAGRRCAAAADRWLTG